VATKPIMDGTDVIFCNNDEFVATKVELSSLRRRNEKFNIYKTIVSNEERGEEEIHIIHESSLDLFDEMLDNLKSEALSQKQGTDAAGKEWKKYYSFRDSFADVRNCHALTTHKAQGSTYDMVFVCASDIASNIKKQEMIRLLYTAFTRSSKRLIIIPM
jgi:superfamily I DNA/RNA helicase